MAYTRLNVKYLKCLDLKLFLNGLDILDEQLLLLLLVLDGVLHLPAQLVHCVLQWHSFVCLDMTSAVWDSVPY
jgi:hypothetical protein